MSNTHDMFRDDKFVMGISGMRKPAFTALKENTSSKEIDVKPGEE